MTGVEDGRNPLGYLRQSTKSAGPVVTPSEKVPTNVLARSIPRNVMLTLFAGRSRIWLLTAPRIIVAPEIRVPFHLIVTSLPSQTNEGGANGGVPPLNPSMTKNSSWNWICGEVNVLKLNTAAAPLVQVT